MSSNIKKRIPWWAKFSVKIFTGAFGINSLLHKVGVYSHGNKGAERNFKVFSTHYESVRTYLPKHFTMLELGPGYSLASAVFAAHYGASRTYFIEEGSYAREQSRQEAEELVKEKFGSAPENVEYTYLTKGLASLKELPDNSIDFIFSNSVLEHVRKDEFLPLMQECRRVLKPNGVCSHWIDLKDHLGASLHSLRFSDRFWEGKLIKHAGFYTNRLRYSQLLSLFREADFSVKVFETGTFDEMKLSRAQFAREFKNLSDEDIAISGCHVLLYPSNE